MIENLVYAFILVFSLTLLAISIQAFRRSGKVKVLMISFALLLFFSKGILFTIQLFVEPFKQETLWVLSGLCDIGILSMIFLAVLKR
jgi:hypothetical protein